VHKEKVYAYAGKLPDMDVNVFILTLKKILGLKKCDPVFNGYSKVQARRDEYPRE